MHWELLLTQNKWLRNLSSWDVNTHFSISIQLTTNVHLCSSPYVMIMHWWNNVQLDLLGQKKQVTNTFCSNSKTTTPPAMTTTTNNTFTKTNTGTTNSTTQSSTTTITCSTPPTKLRKLNWTRPNYKGIYHDNRRLLDHRAKKCECHVCFHELHKLPPAETNYERIAARNSKLSEQEIKRAKKKAKKDVKAGKQATIQKFFK